MSASQEFAKTLPAPKTFAPSREDILSTLAFFFGDPASPEKLKDYSEAHASTFHFPDAFYGSNTRIRETLNNLILKSPQDWQTTVALPFVRIQGTVVEWDELRFDVRLLQRVPYEGVSRMQTSLRRRHRDRVVRRGIGMNIESDFYTTEAGRAHFSDQLTSIRYCVQETCNFDCLYAYLTCGNYDFRYDMQKGLRPRRSVRTAMSNEIAMYAIAQRDGLGFDKAVETAKSRMQRYGVTPNMLVVPPQLALYMNIGSNDRIKYNEAGPGGPAQFAAGAAGFEASTFRGCGVFTSVPYEVSDDTDSVQMLQRSSQVGEFYRMKSPEVGKADPAAVSAADIVIYDEESDKHQHITLAQALLAAGATTIQRADPDTPAGNLKAEIVKALGTITDSTLTAQDLFNPQTIKTELEAGRPLPFEVVICRPFIEHLMMSCVLAVAGRDTGATLFGPADMQISANTSVKTIEGHYTCHTKSVITKPQNVHVIRDVLCSGYVAGGNTSFFGEKEAGGKGKPITSQQVRNAIEKRLSFMDDASGEYESMLAFIVPAGDGAKRDQVVSLSARLLPWEVTMRTDDQKTYFPGGRPGWLHYSQEYALEQLHYGEDVRAAESQEFIAQGSVNNALCFIGPHRVYSPWSATYQELIPGQGHFGPDALPGDARWRRGEAVSSESARTSMVGIEAATHSQLVFARHGA